MLNLLNPIINSKSVWKTQSIKFLGDYYFSTKEFKKLNNIIQTCLMNDESVNFKKVI